MTDFHTHILPCMDDGSGSAGEKHKDDKKSKRRMKC